MNQVTHVRHLRRQAEEWDLDGREILGRFTDNQLARIYNGLGPDSFPAWLREFVTDMNPSLEPAALIHDVEWEKSDRTRAGFDESNARFRANGIKIAKAKFSWWRPRRYAVMAQAKKFAFYCQKFGWHAWVTPSAEKSGKWE